ncbi:hypothetical protein [Bradyrhizobium sp. AZCC 2289]|uniref:hypothetical protein n=1 Tax=Bradyrhizobium sp. AZCC 2289 TaxID=3117026 RepID=UPI002FF0AEDD
MINVLLNGKKLFHADLVVNDLARIDVETNAMAKDLGVTPLDLWHSVLGQISKNGHRWSTRSKEVEMMVVSWGLLKPPSTDPALSGAYGDYLDMWDFDFDIEVNPETHEVVAFDVAHRLGKGVRVLS